MKNRGFSLVELVVVIAIIGTLATVATIAFSSWQKKYGIEAQVKEMVVDLTDVRMMAIHTKRAHLVTLNPSSMVFRRFSSEADATGTEVMNKTLKYPIQQFASGTLTAFGNTPIAINDRGYTSDLMSIVVGSGLGGDPAYNCLVIHRARVNIGRINGNDCVLQ